MIKCIIGFLLTQKIEFHFISLPKNIYIRGQSQRFEKGGEGGGGGAICQPPWLPDEENFRFQMV